MMEARPTSERKQLHVPHDELEKDLTIEDRSPRHNGLLSGTEKPGDDETARRNSKTPIPQPSTRSNDAPFENGPPSLPFSLRDHGFPITVFCLLIATEFCFIPLSLYYGLTFRTKLNHRAGESVLCHNVQQHLLTRIASSLLHNHMSIRIRLRLRIHGKPPLRRYAIKCQCLIPISPATGLTTRSSLPQIPTVEQLASLRF